LQPDLILTTAIMAAPPEVDCKHLTGKFVMNKTLSDDVDALLTLQGIGWWTRKAIGLATVVLTIKEYTKDHFIHIDIVQVASGLSTSNEDRVLNWTDVEHPDKIFGTVIGRSRMFKAEDFSMVGPGGPDDATFLQGKKLKDMKTDTSFLDHEHVQSFVTSVKGGWTAEQIWGFETIDGKKYYTRRVVGRKGDKVERVRLVYDYKGQVATAMNDDDDGLAYGEDN
jgi:hypothetical protein